jgi:putative transposase
LSGYGTSPTLLLNPRNARCVVPAMPYHVMQRGTNRQLVFHPTDYKMYLSLVREQLADAECRVLAYCLSSNPRTTHAT